MAGPRHAAIVVAAGVAAALVRQPPPPLTSSPRRVVVDAAAAPVAVARYVAVAVVAVFAVKPLAALPLGCVDQVQHHDVLVPIHALSPSRGGDHGSECVELAGLYRAPLAVRQA